MNDKMILAKMRESGFVFDGATRLIPKDGAGRARVAGDAAMVTPPNSGIPTILTSIVDPTVVEILTAPRNAREIFGEVKKGDWTTTSVIFRTAEMTGDVTPYGDYQNGAMADVNITYPERQNCLFQTHIRYGQYEMAMSGQAMINLASEKQKSAANIIDTWANRFALYGVEGREIYGLLNDPNLPASIAPESINGVTLWSDKTTAQIYNDILKMASNLFTRLLGNIDATSDLVLAIAPATSVELAKATDFNISVMDMLKKYFSNLTVVVLPELATESGNTVMLIARSVKGQPTAQLGFSEKMRTFPVIQHTSWYEQKFAFGTYGAIVYHPYAIETMVGV